MNLVTLLMAEPVVAVDPGEDTTLHAVTADGIDAGDWPTPVLRSACGVSGVKLVENAGYAGDPVPWPPPARGLPEGFSRCRECWVATGKKRPRARVQVVPS